MARDRRRLAAIVSADVAGYSRLMERDESGTLAILKTHRYELIDPKIAEYGGRIVKTTGDGLLLEFPSVVDAVRCAVDVQRGMLERNTDVAADRRIEFRVGINVGDIIIDADDIFGDGVNVAARLQTLAQPGDICVSKAVRDQVLDKLNFAFEELGSREVKNISRPIEVYRVELNGGMPRNANQAWSNSHRLTNYAPRPIRLAAAAIAVAAIAIGLWTAVFREMTASASPPNVTVAVLPFMAKRPEPNDLALAELVTNNLSRALRRESNLPVVNVEAATNSAVDTRSIGTSLNAAYIVKGEIQHLGDHLEISVQLLEATSGRNLWNDRLTVETTAIDNVEATAPLRLVSSLGGALYAANLARFSAPPPSNAGPLELTMHGKAVWSRDNNTMSGTLEARKWFDKALRLDPNFIPALSGRFQTLVYEQDFDPNADGDRIVREMDQLAFHMVNLDNTRPRLWIWRAEALMRQGKYEAAEAAVSQAERLSVRVPDSLSYRAELLILTGRPNEAVGPLNEEVALGLQDQQELGSVALLRCRAMLALGRYDESIRDCERNVALDDWWLPHVYLLAAYTLEGDVTKSASEKAALSKLRPGISIDDVKKHYFSSAPKFVEQADAHLLAGLRKAGIPER